MTHTAQHIVLVSLDTLRADCINAAPMAREYTKKHKNAIRIDTSCLDTLFRSSRYYNNCFSAAPYTSASHGAYFTGQWPLHNGLYEFFNRKLAKPTIFSHAKKMGYTTIFQTDFPIMLGSYLGFTDGIDSYYVENEEAAFKELKKNRNNKTLSFFHFGGIHYPYGFHTVKFGGDDYRRKVTFLEKKYSVALKNIGNLDDVLNETFRTKEDTELLLRYKYIIQNLYGGKKYDDLFNLYLEGIEYFLKHRFESFITKLRDFVDETNAILFLFGDHGEEWDEYSEGHHNSIDDTVLRVPLLVYGNGVSVGVENKLIRTVDVAPTVMSMLEGKRKKVTFDGAPLDIFSSTSNFPTSSYAISQVWKSIATMKQIASYQKYAIKNKKLTKPLNTYLHLESIRTNSDKEVHCYNQEGKQVTTKQTVKGKSPKLKKILKDYNASKIKKNKRVTIESKIRQELSGMGYRV